jgi:2',3'-cyclic-nucleotide 2'-phosphodiesterase (5'-nucleotidase family)
MGNFFTEAMRAVFDADLAFNNNGGMRADLPAGDITVEDLLTVEPFGNSLVLVDMDGRTIRRIFERKSRRGSSGISQSGAEIVVDPDADDGQRVLELRIGGEPVQPDKVYRVATSDYLMEGNSGLDFLAQIPPDQVDYTGVLMRESLSRYLREHSPIRPRRDDRWQEKSGGTMAPYLQGWTVP